MKIKQQKLLDKLLQIDERLVNIWLQDDLGLSDEEIWDLFVVLLETRVELLRTCKDAGVKLTEDIVLPDWLGQLVNSRQEIRLREIKQLARDLKRRRQVLAYETAKLKSTITQSAPSTTANQQELDESL